MLACWLQSDEGRRLYQQEIRSRKVLILRKLRHAPRPLRSRSAWLDGAEMDVPMSSPATHGGRETGTTSRPADSGANQVTNACCSARENHLVDATCSNRTDPTVDKRSRLHS